MKKKLIAIVASLAMVATMVPATAFAEGSEEPTPAPTPKTATLAAAAENDHSGAGEGEGYKALFAGGNEDNVTITPVADGLKLSGALPYAEFKDFSSTKSMQTGHYIGFKIAVSADGLIRSERTHTLVNGAVITSTDYQAITQASGMVNRTRLDGTTKKIEVDWPSEEGAPEADKWYTTDGGSLTLEGTSTDDAKFVAVEKIPALTENAVTLTFDTKNLTLLTEEETEALDAWVEKVNDIAKKSEGTSAYTRAVTYARETYDALSADLKAVIDKVDNLDRPKNYKKVYGKMVDAEETVANGSALDNIYDKIARLKALPKTAFKDQAEIEGYFKPLDEVNKLVAGLDSAVKLDGAEKAELDKYNTAYNALIKKYVDPKYAAAEKIDLTKETLEEAELALIQELKIYVDGGYIKTANIANFKQTTYDALIAALEKVEKDAKSLANAEITVAGADSIVYDGTKKTPELTVTIGGKEVPAEAYDAIYSDNKDAGEAIVTIIPKDESGYIGKKEATFTIKAAALTDAMVKSVANATYTGKAVTPAVTVENGVTYTVAYSNNTAVGKATATITGTGNYTGTITKNFIVKPATEAISSLKAGKKSLTVAYKAQTGAKYRIVYSPAKGQAKAVNTTATKKTIKSLKAGKTYKVKVRAYKVIDGTTYNGYYSTVKKVKVK